MPVRRPAAGNPQLSHDSQPVSIRQREFLVREFPHDAARFGKLGNIESQDCQTYQRIDECEELHSSFPIIAAKKPTMASAITNDEVIRGGGSENSRRNSAWKL